MRTILVSGASGVVGYGILKSLADTDHLLIGTTIYDYSIATAFCDYVEKILPTEHPGYIEQLCTIIDKYHVDMIIPSIECDMYKWNKARNVLLSTRAFPLLNNSELIDLCYDKWAFYEKLMDNSPQYAIPTVIGTRDSPYPFPFLLKPRHGYGSRGIIKIKDEKDFGFYQDKIRGCDLMIQPIIGTEEEEYTVSGFFDKKSSLVDYFPLKRKLSKEGFTQEAEVEDRNFGNVLIELAKIFKPIGPTNFQFRMQDGMPKLLEINPRISSATSIRALFMYNEAKMSIDYFINFIRPQMTDKSILTGRKAIRYMEDFIF
jgi:carbamoyl-phosphate synthase large subunit